MLINFNQPLNSWNIQNVTNMKMMFSNSTNFNQPLNNWNVQNVINMELLFKEAINFNQPLHSWNVQNVTNMVSMFNGATIFNQSLNNWNVQNVTNMSGMFSNAINFNTPLNNWNVQNITNMMDMFNGATNFNQKINNWNTTNVSNYSNMFQNAASMISTYNNFTGFGITPTSSFFNHPSSFISKDSITGIVKLNSFYYTTDSSGNNPTIKPEFTTIILHTDDLNPVEHLIPGDLTNTKYRIISTKNNISTAFKVGTDLTITYNYVTTLITDMTGIFNTQQSFNRDISSWDVSNVITMLDMFKHHQISINP